MQDFLSRSSLLWLLAALCSVLFVHVGHLPWWVLIVAVVAIGWRLLMHVGRLGVPPKWLKTLLVAAGFAGVYYTYGHDFSVESTVALFAVGTLLKPLEVHSQRDTYVLLFMCYFFSAVQFLFDQDPQTAIAVLAALVLTMSAQISLNLQGRMGGEAPMERFAPAKLSAVILLQSIPLAILLFVFIPRVAPLWTLNVKTQAGTTGLSDRMTPGDIAKLGASEALAFIATFETPVPSNEKLYWRALTLDHFDGHTWSMTRGDTTVEWGSEQHLVEPSHAVKYQVMLEPHDQNWLVGLDWAQPMTSNTGLTSDFRLVNRHAVVSKTLYRVHSDVDTQFKPSNIDWQSRERLTQLPARMDKGLNPRTKALAQQLQSQVKNDEEYIRKVTDFYRQQPFAYTLKPGNQARDNTIDAFLFDAQKGFCAHYAGSFTYLMRLGGIPARVVTGYQGGEWNEQNKYLAVYQFNAHAWVEVWLNGNGWTRIDPTTFVAPERVLDGVEDALQDEFTGRSVFSSRRWQWLNSARLKLEALNYYWHIWVLSYDQAQQQSLIERLFGKTSVDQYALFLIGMVLTAMGVLAGLLLWRNRAEPLPPIQREYQRLTVALSKRGIVTLVGASPNQVLTELAHQQPAIAQDALALGRLFDAYLYGAKSAAFSEQDRRTLKKRVIKLIRKVQTQRTS